MLTKRYEAETLNEALVAARQELGEGVVVLHSKRKIVGGIPFLGNLFGRECYEVLVGVAESGDSDLPLTHRGPGRMAAAPIRHQAAPPRQGIDLMEDSVVFPDHAPAHTPPPVYANPWVRHNPPTAQPQAKPPPPQVAPPLTNGHAAAATQQAAFAPAPPAQAPNPVMGQMTELRGEIQSLKDAMSQFLRQQEQQSVARPPAPAPVPVAPAQPQGWQGPWRTLAQTLLSQGVENPLVDMLLAEAQALNGLPPRQALQQVLLSRLQPAGGIAPRASGRPHVCVFVGPTGVGKTTTIAKVAAGLTLIQNYQVCLASADTYRIAAVEQLRIYADIIGIPMEVLYGAQDVPGFLERRGDMDILLVDTAGRSPRNDQQMGELSALVQALDPGEIFFVVAANLSSEDSLGALERFAHVGANRLVLTKLDESQRPGVLLNLTAKTGTPISYVTTGQSVPDDILEPAAADLAAWVLGERSLP